MGGCDWIVRIVVYRNFGKLRVHLDRRPKKRPLAGASSVLAPDRKTNAEAVEIPREERYLHCGTLQIPTDRFSSETFAAWDEKKNRNHLTMGSCHEP